jgi:hypothetical protein
LLGVISADSWQESRPVQTGLPSSSSVSPSRWGDGKLTIAFTPTDGGEPMQFEVAEYGDDGGIAMGMSNFDASIRDFARACLRYGLDRSASTERLMVLRRPMPAPGSDPPSRPSLGANEPGSVRSAR